MRGKTVTTMWSYNVKIPQPPVKAAGENFAFTLDYCRELLKAEALT